MALGPELVAFQAVRLSLDFVGGKVRKVEASDNWVAFSFSRDRTLFFSWDAEFYGLCSAFPSEVRGLETSSRTTPPILGALKSHIVGAELTDASAPGRDRVLRLGFKRPIGAGVYQRRTLILEASGRYSNVILLDDDGVIAEAAKHIHPDTNRYRSVIPGYPYIPPPAVDGVSLDDFDGAEPCAAEGLNRVVGIGKPLIKAIIASGAEAVASVGALKNFEPPLIFQSIGKYVSVFPSLLEGSARMDAGDALCAARDAVILPLIARRAEAIRKKISEELRRAAASNEKKISENESLANDDGPAEELMRVGKLILENSHSIAPRSSEAELTEWTESGEQKRIVALDPKLDAVRNAEKYFARYKKKRIAAGLAEKNLPGLYAKRSEIEEQSALLECCRDLSVLSMMAGEVSAGAKKTGARGGDANAAPPHRRREFDSGAAVIFWGLSAKGNRYVTFKLARPDDIWLHARNIPGTHVILRFNAEPDEATYDRMIEAASSCAAYHSRGRLSGRVQVDFTERRHVRAIAGGGAASVTYKNFSTITANVADWLEEGSAQPL